MIWLAWDGLLAFAVQVDVCVRGRAQAIPTRRSSLCNAYAVLAPRYMCDIFVVIARPVDMSSSHCTAFLPLQPPAAYSPNVCGTATTRQAAAAPALPSWRRACCWRARRRSCTRTGSNTGCHRSATGGRWTLGQVRGGFKLQGREAWMGHKGDRCWLNWLRVVVFGLVQPLSVLSGQ